MNNNTNEIKKWYNKNATNYFKESQKISLKNLDSLNQFTTLLPIRSKILDAACGGGHYTNLMNKNEFDAIGIDISRDLIKEAKENYNPDKFIISTITKLPFDSDIFDGIWSHASILHLESKIDVSNTLNEFYRVLKKGGIIHLHSRLQLSNCETEVVEDGRFYRYFQKEVLSKELEEIGFEILDYQTHPDSRGRDGIKWFIFLLRKS